MAAPTQYYVDPSLGADTGDGTVGTPWGRASGSVVQYALDTITRDGTGGDQINVKAGTDDVLGAAINLTTNYGTPSSAARLIIRGYTSTADDGGQGGISGAGTYSIFASASGYLSWIDMHLHNCGSANVLQLASYCHIAQCEIDNSTGRGIDASGASGVLIISNYVHNIGGVGVSLKAGKIVNNYLSNGTNDFDDAIYMSNLNGTIIGNIISIDGTSDGINTARADTLIMNNSILSAGGTGSGIKHQANWGGYSIINNLVEGFSGVGGDGILRSASADGFMFAHNGVYNCATSYGTGSEDNIVTDNESLGASPFAKSGADTFANRFVYFAPVDTGNVHGGAYVG